MSHFLSQRWLLSRRHMLKGAGAMLALPVLDAMTPLRAANAAAAVKAKRSVFIYIPNGVNGMSWQVTKSGRDFDFSRTLKPLENHREDLSIFSGLYHPNCTRLAHVCQDTWLTGTSAEEENSRSYKNTVSCDQVIAEVTSQYTRFPSLELSIEGGAGKQTKAHSLAFSRDGIALPAEDNPRRVFDRLFGHDEGGIHQQRERLRRRQSILDAVLDDAHTFRMNLGYDDTCKLDEYLQSVRDVEQRVHRLDAWLDVPKQVVPAEEQAYFYREVPKVEAGEYYRTMLDLIVIALRTDMTRVVTYMSGLEGGGLAIPEIGVSQTRHMLSHHNFDPEVLEALTKSDEFFMQQFAYFLDRLKQATDGGEPLLDSTMVLIGSGMSYGHSHSTVNLPIVLAGGRGLGIKHGQHIDYNVAATKKEYDLSMDEWRSLCSRPKDEKARLSNLLLTMMQKSDVPIEKFVDSLGPISEIT